jgi:hypothetical protein
LNKYFVIQKTVLNKSGSGTGTGTGNGAGTGTGTGTKTFPKKKPELEPQ